MRNHRLTNSLIRHVFRVAIVGLLAIMEHAAPADEASFVGTGIAGNTSAQMTPDGRYFVTAKWREGDTLNADSFDIVRWERGGPQLVLDFPGTPNGISDDGSVIVGTSGKFYAHRAFRWSAAGVEYLAPRHDSTASHVSGDGNTVLVYRKDTPLGDPEGNYIWTTKDGLQLIPPLPGHDWTHVTYDGTVLGFGEEDEIYRWSTEANQWTPDARFPGLFTLPPGFSTSGWGVFTPDLSVVAGVMVQEDGQRMHARWTAETGAVALPTLGGEPLNRSGPRGISADGSVIVGVDRDVSDGRAAPFIWDSVQGTRELTSVLRDEYDLGAELAAWDLTEAIDISADGRTILGHGLNPAGVREFWVAYLPPAPGDFDGNGQLDVTDIDALTGHIQSGGTAASFDLNADNIVDLGDLKVWVEDLKQTFFGDANLDGVFSSRDLVGVFQVGHYEDAIEDNSTWATGDWNADLDFTSSDLVMAFQDGGYEKGERVIVAVPEPSNVVWILAWMTTVTRRPRRRMWVKTLRTAPRLLVMYP